MKVDVRNIINKYGNKIILEELISHTGDSIVAARSFNLDTDVKYLEELLDNLTNTLETYNDRYDQPETE